MRRLAALTAAAAALAGCSAGDDGPTREEWAADANELCRTYERRIRALGTPTTPEAAQAFIRRALPLAREEVEELRALERPDDDEARIEEMLDAVDDGIAALEDVVAARDEGDTAAVDDATARGQRAADRANGIARDLGAATCASTSAR